jgi:predicted enzyme related to lactoylglutathione lyase
MHEPDRYPPGVPCWIEASAPDPRAALEFYGSLFGWSFDERSGRHVARLDGADVAGIAAEAGPARWTTYVRVDDSTAASKRVTGAGGRIVGIPAGASAMARTALVADPAGTAIGVWEPVEHGGAQLVNAPGTWNWSNLATPDPETAMRFYGEAFGWEAMPMGEGVWMWRVPGYGALLAERDPAVRARHDQPGIPPGFSDAVAWLAPVAGDVPEGWGVVFAVDDTDAVAERAAALGAVVLTPPRDEGPTRTAVLRDPHGAVVRVSCYSG